MSKSKREKVGYSVLEFTGGGEDCRYASSGVQMTLQATGAGMITQGVHVVEEEIQL